MKFSVISLYLTKLYVTLSFAIVSSLTDNEIRQIFSSSVPRLRYVRPAGWVTCYSTVYARVQCREPKRFNSQVRQNTLSIWVYYLTTVCSSYTGRTACTGEYLTLWLDDLYVVYVETALQKYKTICYYYSWERQKRFINNCTLDIGHEENIW